MKVKNTRDVFAAIELGDHPQTPKMLEKVNKLMSAPPGKKVPVKTVNLSIPAAFVELASFIARSQKRTPQKFMGVILTERLYEVWNAMRREQSQKAISPPTRKKKDHDERDVPF